MDSDGSGNHRESAENSLVHHFDGDITGLSSLIREQTEDNGRDNLVSFVMASLTEQTRTPEDQLQEMFALILDERRWEDFSQNRLPQLFDTMAKKLEQVVEKLA